RGLAAGDDAVRALLNAALALAHLVVAEIADRRQLTFVCVAVAVVVFVVADFGAGIDAATVGVTVIHPAITDVAIVAAAAIAVARVAARAVQAVVVDVAREVRRRGCTDRDEHDELSPESIDRLHFAPPRVRSRRLRKSQINPTPRSHEPLEPLV